MSTTTTRSLAAILFAAVLAIGLVGCSSSDDSDDSDAGGTTASDGSDATATSAAAFDIAAFEPTEEQCATLDSSPTDEADVEARAALFPEGLQDDISEYIGGLLAHNTSADPDTGVPTVEPPVANETLQTLMVTCASLVGGGSTTEEG